MPPPHLHPRSRLTTSLFGTTLLVSFLVVGMPHILPCPAPRLAFADGETTADDGPKRRRRRPRQRSPSEDLSGESEEDPPATRIPDEKTKSEEHAHQCPVPKPRGLVGEMLGFGRGEKDAPRPRVRVETRDEEGRHHDGD